MSKITFTIATSSIDYQGDMFVPGCFQHLGYVPMLMDFSIKPEDYLGDVKIITQEDTLKAEADLPDELLDMYPAIGFQILESREENGVRLLEKIRLQCVGLSSNPNVDPSIKTIREQQG